MRTLRSVLSGLGASATWPSYLGLAAYAVRQSPMPRDLGLALATTLGLLALAWFTANLLRWLLGEGGPAEASLGIPPEVTRQFRWAGLTLVAGHVVLLLPVYLLSHGLIVSGTRPVTAITTVRLLIIAFEAGVLVVTYRLVRPKSAAMHWAADLPERFRGLTRFRRPFAALMMAGVAGLIALDVRGYCFSARRLSTGAAGSAVVLAVCLLIRRLICDAIGRHAWRWTKTATETAAVGGDAPPDLAARLRLLSTYAVAALGLFLTAWVWDVDLALFRFISEQELWSVAGTGQFVTIGDLTRCVAVLTLCGIAWRHMSTFFAVCIFPRMPDDPGIRFAVVTLCRYSVLGVGLLAGLSAVHLGLDKIGLALATLGVGIGFGLQEVVSNFVCGIILLLERPIRVGDTVTVGSMTGKVNRINIRATTIINGDNLSIIVPNRAFITGDLINWTLKDKVIRLTIKVQVAFGTDPDRVSELLTAIARDDDDILRNPVPSAFVEEFGDASMAFTLHAHVPEPGLGGRVKHRLIGQIQRRFREAGILIPLPTQELVVKSFNGSNSTAWSHPGEYVRFDAASPTPPGPTATPPAVVHAPEPLEECHRGVDE